MYAAIFRAEIAELDRRYSEMARRMRDLAMNDYGCLEFHSATEGNREIAVSYWENLEQIRAWKQDGEHRRAQELGRSKWYASYQVQVVKIIRDY